MLRRRTNPLTAVMAMIAGGFGFGTGKIAAGEPYPEPEAPRETVFTPQPVSVPIRQGPVMSRRAVRNLSVLAARMRV